MIWTVSVEVMLNCNTQPDQVYCTCRCLETLWLHYTLLSKYLIIIILSSEGKTVEEFRVQLFTKVVWI